jgi:hypothetical protein
MDNVDNSIHKRDKILYWKIDSKTYQTLRRLDRDPSIIIPKDCIFNSLYILGELSREYSTEYSRRINALDRCLTPDELLSHFQIKKRIDGLKKHHSLMEFHNLEDYLDYFKKNVPRDHATLLLFGREPGHGHAMVLVHRNDGTIIAVDNQSEFIIPIKHLLEYMNEGNPTVRLTFFFVKVSKTSRIASPFVQIRKKSSSPQSKRGTSTLPFMDTDHVRFFPGTTTFPTSHKNKKSKSRTIKRHNGGMSHNRHNKTKCRR